MKFQSSRGPMAHYGLHVAPPLLPRAFLTWRASPSPLFSLTPLFPFPPSPVAVQARPTSARSRGRRVGTGASSTNKHTESWTSGRCSSRRRAGGQTQQAQQLVHEAGQARASGRRLTSEHPGASHSLLSRYVRFWLQRTAIFASLCNRLSRGQV
jgi:hypothetical protein